jgi:hypothetical protein
MKKGRGRPKKDPALRMDVDLRIPVTDDQKEAISEAARADQTDLATWARPILLRAAERRLAKEDESGKR